MFSTLSKTNFKFLVAFDLSSANGFNLNKSKILSSGEDLLWYHMHFDILVEWHSTLSQKSPGFYVSAAQVF